jgi:hypothetical protein
MKRNKYTNIKLLCREAGPMIANDRAVILGEDDRSIRDTALDDVDFTAIMKFVQALSSELPMDRLV